MVDHTGFEPVTPCMSSKCSNRAELMIHEVYMVPETGIEPVTLSLEGSCSIQLSYSGREVCGGACLFIRITLYLCSRTVGIIWKIGGKRGEF